MKCGDVWKLAASKPQIIKTRLHAVEEIVLSFNIGPRIGFLTHLNIGCFIILDAIGHRLLAMAVS